MKWILALLVLCAVTTSSFTCSPQEQLSYSIVTPQVAPAQVYGYFAPPAATYGYLAASAPLVYAAPAYGYAAPPPAYGYGVPYGVSGPSYGFSYGAAFGTNRVFGGGFGFPVHHRDAFFPGRGVGVRVGRFGVFVR